MKLKLDYEPAEFTNQVAFGAMVIRKDCDCIADLIVVRDKIEWETNRGERHETDGLARFVCKQCGSEPRIEFP